MGRRLRQIFALLAGALALLGARTEEAEAAPRRIGIFQLQVVGLPQELATTAIDALGSAIGSMQAGEVVTAQELNALLEAEMRKDLVGCDDVSCFSELGAAFGIDELVTGSLTALDSALVVSLQRIDARRAKVQRRVTLSWSGPHAALTELLGAAADRLVLAPERQQGRLVMQERAEAARWYIDGQAVLGLARVVPAGVYTVKVEAPGHAPWHEQVVLRAGAEAVVRPQLRSTDEYRLVGLGLSAGGLIPLADGYVSTRPGLALSLLYGFELQRLLLQLRAGGAFDLDRAREQTYLELGADAAVSWSVLAGEMTPVIGLGVGARWLRTTEAGSAVLGSILVARQQQVVASGFGPGGFARVGGLFFRYSPVRLTVAVDYRLAYIGRATRQSIQTALELMF